MEGHERLAKVARRHHGLLTSTQVTEVGISRRSMQCRVNAGVWSRISPSVLRLVGAPESPEQRALAAILDAGPGAKVTAAARRDTGPHAGGPGGHGHRPAARSHPRQRAAGCGARASRRGTGARVCARVVGDGDGRARRAPGATGRPLRRRRLGEPCRLRQPKDWSGRDGRRRDLAQRALGRAPR
jgi:hypothetical protein